MCGACLLLLLGKNRAPSSILSRKKNVVSIRHENTLLSMASTLNGYSYSTVMAICPCINSRLTTANPNSSKNLVFHHLSCIVVDNIVRSLKAVQSYTFSLRYTRINHKIFHLLIMTRKKENWQLSKSVSPPRHVFSPQPSYISPQPFSIIHDNISPRLSQFS